MTCCFAEDLGGDRLPRRARRFVVPWIIATQVLRARASGKHYDVVEIHEPLAYVYAALARLSPGSLLPPCVVLSHGVEECGWIAQRWRWRIRGTRPSRVSLLSVLLTRLLPARIGLRSARAIIVPSRADQSYLVNVRGIAESRVFTTPTGVSLEFFGVNRRNSVGIGVIFVGTWIDRKGTPELVAAWERLAYHPDVHLTLAGTQVARDLVLADFPPAVRERVSVEPTVDDARLMDLLASHDIFVLPSWFEGMPLSMLEAAATGLPCVVSSVCGNRDFIREADPPADGGILVPPHDETALANAVERLICDPSLRTMLGSRARIRARQFTWSQTAARTEPAYRSALTPDRGASAHSVR